VIYTVNYILQGGIHHSQAEMEFPIIVTGLAVHDNSCPHLIAPVKEKYVWTL
jgi:hypothetical protein